MGQIINCQDQKFCGRKKLVEELCSQSNVKGRLSSVAKYNNNVAINNDL